MSSEYNSKLIDDLYQTSDPEKAKRILEEIREISDPIFIYSLFTGYKKFKYASNSHYFIAALNEIKSKEVLNVLTEIISDPEVEPLIYTYALGGFLRYEYFEHDIISKAKLILYEFVANQTNINLENLLEYLKKAGAISELTDQLRTIFEDDKFEPEERLLSLSYLLNTDSKKWVQFYIDNHTKIVNKQAEILLSKTLISWRGPLVEELKGKITKDGGSRAREIIESAQKREAEVKEESAKKESISYSNSKVITEIVELREKINRLSSIEKNIGFSIFPLRESIYKQLEAAIDEAGLINCCIELRSLFQDIEKAVGDHGISFEEAATIIPGISKEDFNKSINKLHLFLYSRKIEVDADLYGLRTVNRLVNLWAHPDRKKELISLLEKLTILEMYKKEDWTSLHRRILELYRTSLDKLHQTLINLSKI